MTSTETPPRPSLAEVLRFSPDDLNANRAGLLADGQRDRLLRQWTVTRVPFIIALIVIGLLATVFLFFGGESDSPVLNVIGVGLTLVNAAIVGLAANTWLRTRRDVRDGRVQTLEGELRHTIRINRRVRVYMLDIAGERLAVPRPVFNAFEEGVRYRLYRAPFTGLLLSAERV
jgi:hypothetical protein